MKIRKLYINNYKIFQDVELDFTCNGETQNLIVIAGINGSGKTTLFENFIYPTFKNKVILRNSFIEIEYQEKGKLKNFIINTQSLKSDFFKDSKYRDNFLFPKFKNVIFYKAGVSDKKTAKETIVQFIDNLIYEEDKKSSE